MLTDQWISKLTFCINLPTYGKKKGDYQRVCQSKAVAANELTAAAMYSPLLAMASLRGVPAGLRKSSVFLSINKKRAIALVDAGSTDSFIHPRLVGACCLKIQPTKETISMATSSLTAPTKGYCTANIETNDREYLNVKLHVFPNLCADVILGQKWQAMHESFTINYGVEKPPVKICNLTTLDVTPSQLFQYLSPD